MAKNKKKDEEIPLDDHSIYADRCLSVAKKANAMADDLSVKAKTSEEMMVALTMATESFRLASSVISFSEHNEAEDAWDRGFDFGYEQCLEDMDEDMEDDNDNN